MPKCQEGDGQKCVLAVYDKIISVVFYSDVYFKMMLKNLQCEAITLFVSGWLFMPTFKLISQHFAVGL